MSISNRRAQCVWMRPVRPLLAVMIALAARQAQGQKTSSAPDPIEGRWWGKSGFPLDVIEVGFEFKRDSAGDLRAYLFQPTLNFYGLMLPGIVHRTDSTYEVPEYLLKVTLRDGKLEGTYHSLSAPLSLARAKTLPREVAIPAFPTGPGPTWSVKLGAPIYAPAAIKDGVAYVGTTGGVFFAIDIATGKTRWTFAAGRPIYAQATAADSAVYVHCENGYLFKLDRNTGREAWRYDLGDARSPRITPLDPDIDPSFDFDLNFDYRASRPVLSDDVIYVGAGDGGFHAVDARTGTRKWRFEAQGSIRGDALIDGDRVLFGSWDGDLYAVNSSTGVELWKRETGAIINNTPSLIDGKIIVGNRGGLLVAFNPETGKTAWRMNFWGSSVESDAIGAAGDDSLFYIGASDLRRVTLADARDGRVLWRSDVYGWAWNRVALTEHRLYLGVSGATPYQMRHKGSLVALDRKTGKIAWRWPMPEWPGAWLNGFIASPETEGKMLVIGGVDGSLYGSPIER